MDLLNVDNLMAMHSAEGRQPMMQSKWIVMEFPEIGGVKLPTSYFETLGLPFAAFSLNTKEVATTNINFPGNSSIDSFELQMFEDEFMTTSLYFQSWADTIQNPYTGGYYTPVHYWKNVRIGFMDSQNRIRTESQIRNAWPIMQSQVTFNQENGRLMTSIQMSCTSQRLFPVNR
jgi:hypothetical protein